MTTPTWGEQPPAVPSQAEKNRAMNKKLLKRVGGGVLGLVVFTSCVAALGGSDEPPQTAPVAAAETEAPEPPSPKPSPSPSPKPKASKNPLASGANKTACASSRREVAKRADVFAGFSNGTETQAAVIKVSSQLQDKMGDAASYAEGAIRVQLAELQTQYGRIKVSMTNNDLDTLAVAVGKQAGALTELNKLCTSIKA